MQRQQSKILCNLDGERRRFLEANKYGRVMEQEVFQLLFDSRTASLTVSYLSEGINEALCEAISGILRHGVHRGVHQALQGDPCESRLTRFSYGSVDRIGGI